MLSNIKHRQCNSGFGQYFLSIDSGGSVGLIVVVVIGDVVGGVFVVVGHPLSPLQLTDQSHWSIDLFKYNLRVKRLCVQLQKYALS